VTDVDVSQNELHWIAGIWEGEGSFFPGPPSKPRSPVMALSMTDEDVVARVARLLGVTYTEVTPKEAHWRPTFVMRLRGARAMAWMAAMRPLMGYRRQRQIDRAMACYDPRPSGILNDDTARMALALLGAGMSVRAVAERFEVTVWCIYDLRLGRTFKHLPRPNTMTP
jgi:hypothetical protein